MPVRWLSIVCVAVLAPGCGSSSDSEDAQSSPATATATSAATQPPTATVESSGLERLPQAPEPSGAPPDSASSGGHAFLTSVFDDAQSLWESEFETAGLEYKPARLTIFRDQVDTACGAQSLDVGPFYCPASSGVYLDTAFFTALSAKVGLKLGDFAQAYVVVHEVGRHVQALLGVFHHVSAADQIDPEGENARSVRVELQADCFAGIWAHTAYRRGELTEADLEDALQAAAVVGDDFLQRDATGTVRPDTLRIAVTRSESARCAGRRQGARGRGAPCRIASSGSV